MTKRKKYTITLIFVATWPKNYIIDPFVTIITINEHNFIIEVGQIESEFGLHPSYICKCDGVQSEICKVSSIAITMVYQKIFQTKTNFLGPEVIGYDTPEVVQEYLHELPFQVNWQKLFQDWVLHEHTIIELRSVLRILYPKEYVI
ncbi:14769_t:CDS:2, partial [Racocetra persica]